MLHCLSIRFETTTKALLLLVLGLGSAWVGAGAEAAILPVLPVPPNLSAPPLARTATTVLLMWDRPADGEGITGYQVHRDGEPAGETTSLSFTARGLAPGKTYRFTVRSIRAGSAVSADSESVVVATKPAGPVLNVRERGARGDGVTRDTAVIQQAINDCPPGGTVLVPPGTYLVGRLELKGDLTFELATGATLRFLGRGEAEYPSVPVRLPGVDGDVTAVDFSLLSARDAKNLTITGGGRINGNGATWWPYRKEGPRPRLFKLTGCSDVFVQDVTFEDSPSWTIHALYVDRAVFSGVTVLKVSDDHGANGDGLDPDSARDVLIVGCRFGNQDDSIAIKSGVITPGQPHRQRSCERITIRDCVFDGTLAPGSRPLGIAVGSETCGGVRQVLIKDCIFRNTASVAYLKANRARAGAVVEDIVVENCVFTNTAVVGQAANRAPLSIDLMYYLDAGGIEAKGPDTPVFRNIHFRNIVINETVRRGVNLVGLPESPVQNLTLTNISVTAKTGLRGENLDGVELRNVTVKAEEGPAYTWINATHRTSHLHQ
jgi:exo-poly-alpha-galacturonosidase